MDTSFAGEPGARSNLRLERLDLDFGVGEGDLKCLSASGGGGGGGVSVRVDGTCLMKLSWRVVASMDMVPRLGEAKGSLRLMKSSVRWEGVGVEGWEIKGCVLGRVRSRFGVG